MMYKRYFLLIALKRQIVKSLPIFDSSNRLSSWWRGGSGDTTLPKCCWFYYLMQSRYLQQVVESNVHFSYILSSICIRFTYVAFSELNHVPFCFTIHDFLLSSSRPFAKKTNKVKTFFPCWYHLNTWYACHFPSKLHHHHPHTLSHSDCISFVFIHSSSDPFSPPFWGSSSSFIYSIWTPMLDLEQPHEGCHLQTHHHHHMDLP